MKILFEGTKNGRKLTVGQGTYEEVEALNKVKDFNTALDVLIHIKKVHNYMFGTKEGYAVDRSVHGTRKAV